LAGKLFGLETAESMQLAGMLSGSEIDLDKLPNFEKKGGGFELEQKEETTEKAIKINALKTWLNGLDDEIFSVFWDFMQIVTNKEGALTTAINSVEKYKEQDNTEDNIQQI
jgi:hypothetical protein